jgi:hypothetical protein
MVETERYFLSYSGITLPLRLLEEISAEGLAHRNTWFRASYDATGRMLRCEKMVYGDVEMVHDYRYDAAGTLIEATVRIGEDEPQTIRFAR